ncbi:tRNA-splicing endonuclease subunit Sen2 isoform X2 [Thalassophryne amazonica]|uniref:tRNA-splicing endonuclease subunit Sen2 isoform X2 n=1 Tax=Thalassophryne amazonica TaxID=390379 RepID=UPI001471141C|nr:tRNA-splicing endonuclease subunit Sen2 isoform X2 [Thalassophryne amazonica]
MQADFRAPRRRSRVYEEYEAPLPVSGRTEEPSSFQAQLINRHVLVCQPAHSSALYSKGYFGKGVLSRARPDYSISSQWEEHGGLLLPVISQSRYEELLCLARGALSSQGLDNETVSQTLLKISQPVHVGDLKCEVGGEENGYQGKKEEMEPSPKEEVSPHKKRVRTELVIEPEAKRSCREGSEAQFHSEDQKPDPSPQEDHLNSDSNSDADPDPELATSSDSGPHPLVSGPAFVLVVPQNEGDGSIREVRRTPFTLTEYLQLSLEETFFLVYALGCLSVYQHQEPLSIIQLWRTFRSIRPDFVSLYAAYHYYRMLYRKGPPFYHASYSVIVEKIDETFRGSTLRPFTWRSLATLSRITANVSKELLLCYIIYPADLSEAELDSPLCLCRLTVQEVIVSRWVSSRERAEQDDI